MWQLVEQWTKFMISKLVAPGPLSDRTRTWPTDGIRQGRFLDRV
jgi:hypothetical protein